MNTRLKVLRKTLNLSQTEFGERIGVTPSAISFLEKGERNFTEQMVLAICREYRVNETWFRTGIGDPFAPTENALIAQLSEQYKLDELDKKILEIYINLPESHRRAFKDFALKLANAANTPDNIGFIEDVAPPVAATKDEEVRPGWNKGLTEEEAIALVRKRYAAKRGEDFSTTFAKAGNE